MGVSVIPAKTALREARAATSPRFARAALLALVIAAAAAGFLTTGADATAQAVAQSGEDLTRLLRGMAAIKALMVAGVIAGVVWRLGAAVSPKWFAGYALACAAMASGPGMIWGMALVAQGAMLTHGGLIAGAVLLWRDPAVGARLAALVAARRGRAARI